MIFLTSIDFYAERTRAEWTILEKQDDLLKFLLRKGVAFTGEIKEEIGLNDEETARLLALLKKKEMIKRIVTNKVNPPRMFLARMQEFWNDGLYGYNNFMKRTWWVVTELGIEYMKTKYKGQGVRIIESLVRYYNGNILPEESISSIHKDEED